MQGKTKILYIIISVFAAVMLWFYVVGVERPEKEDTIAGIPVTFKGEDIIAEDNALVVTSSKKITVSLQVRGSFVDIASLNTQKSSITATVDLSQITTPGVHRLAYDVRLPSTNNEVTLLERTPYYIEVRIEKIRSRAIEVRVDTSQMTVAEDYIAEEPVVEPHELTINGPEDKVNKIIYAEVVWDRTDMTSTTQRTLEYKLYDADDREVDMEGLTASSGSVTVTVAIQKTREVPLAVEIIHGGGAAEENTVYTISPEFITIKGEPDEVDAINVITVGSVNLAEVSPSGKFTFPIVNIPNGVINLSGERECNVSVEVKDLAVRLIPCENIIAINKPEGYTAEMITKEIQVSIRGRQEDVDMVQEHNIRVVVDLSGVPPETDRLIIPAKVNIDGFSNVGAVGIYNVAVRISPAEQE